MSLSLCDDTGQWIETERDVVDLLEKENVKARITAAYQRDVAEQRKVRAAGEIPPFYESITPEWLTAILCTGTPGAEVVSHRLDGSDDGTSNRRRIFVEYDAAGQAAGLPPSVFCKATVSLVNRILLSTSGVFSEVSFYNRVRRDLAIDAPEAHFAAYDPESYASMVMLKDIANEVQFCSERTVSTRQSVESQLDLLATMHGTFYDSPRLRGQGDLADLFSFSGRFRKLDRQHDFKTCCENGVIAAEHLIPARLFARRDAIWAATVRSVDWHDTQPETITHGDVHLKNWYQRPGGTMGLSDWQVVSRGHWARDVAYAVATALTVEDRRAMERELLRHYLDAFHAKGGPKLSFDEAWTAYRAQMLSALAWWTMTLTPSTTMPDMQPLGTTNVFLGRLGTAVDDLDSIDAA